LELGRSKKCHWPFLDFPSSMLESSKRGKGKKITFDLQLLTPKVRGQEKNIFVQPLLKLLSFMLKSSLRGWTNFFCLASNFQCQKLELEQKNCPNPSWNSKELSSWSSQAWSLGAWREAKAKKFTFNLLGAFENEVREFQERPIENLFARPISGLKKTALGLQLLVPKVGS